MNKISKRFISFATALSMCSGCIVACAENRLIGDVNEDGEITSADALEVLKNIVEVSQEYKENCDVNGDGKINTLDALQILKDVVGLVKLNETQPIEPIQPISNSIKEGQLRSIVFSFVSSAENSSLNYWEQYSYIEDIDDGRGYTAGIIGFTTGTGDLIEVVRKYIELKPENNILEKYIPALEKAIGSDTHDGLGDAFVEDWETACEDKEMKTAQDYILDEMYMNPAVDFANEDGLSPLGQFIYYDAYVMHGEGDDEESFGGIRNATIAKCPPPSKGTDEREFLLAFLKERERVMLMEEAHEDLSRIVAQRKFIDQNNFSLALPLEWTMYGDEFKLTEDMLKTED